MARLRRGIIERSTSTLNIWQPVFSRPLDHEPFDVIEYDRVTGVVVELRALSSANFRAPPWLGRFRVMPPASRHAVMPVAPAFRAVCRLSLVQLVPALAPGIVGSRRPPDERRVTSRRPVVQPPTMWPLESRCRAANAAIWAKAFPGSGRLALGNRSAFPRLASGRYHHANQLLGSKAASKGSLSFPRPASTGDGLGRRRSCRSARRHQRRTHPKVRPRCPCLGLRPWHPLDERRPRRSRRAPTLGRSWCRRRFQCRSRRGCSGCPLRHTACRIAAGPEIGTRHHPHPIARDKRKGVGRPACNPERDSSRTISAGCE